MNFKSEGKQFILLDDYYHHAKDLQREKQYKAAKTLFQEAIPLIFAGKPEWNLNLKREIARELSQLNLALLESEEDIVSFYDSFVNEIQLYEAFLHHADNICFNMDLAIAYSHIMAYFQKIGNYQNAVVSALKKLKYNEVSLEKSHAGEPSSGYDLRIIETSIFNTICGVCEIGNNLSEEERLASYEECLWILMKVIMLNRETAIDIYGLSNSIAEELFVRTMSHAPERARRSILCKISNLIYLATNYGAEEGIVDDIKITFQLCYDFFEKHKESIPTNEYFVWQQFKEIRTSLE